MDFLDLPAYTGIRGVGTNLTKIIGHHENRVIRVSDGSSLESLTIEHTVANSNFSMGAIDVKLGASTISRNLVIDVSGYNNGIPRGVGFMAFPASGPSLGTNELRNVKIIGARTGIMIGGTQNKLVLFNVEVGATLNAVFVTSGGFATIWNSKLSAEGPSAIVSAVLTGTASSTIRVINTELTGRSSGLVISCVNSFSSDFTPRELSCDRPVGAAL